MNKTNNSSNNTKNNNNNNNNNNNATKNNNNNNNTKDDPYHTPSKTFIQALQAHPMILPSAVAFLVIVLAVITIALLVTNTNNAVGNVVNSLQDQVLSLADSRFEQTLDSMLTFNNNTANRLIRTGFPTLPANNTPLLDNGYMDFYSVLDQALRDSTIVDLAYVFLENGRFIGCVRSGANNRYLEEQWPNGLYSFAYAPYNLSALVNLNYSNPTGRSPTYEGYKRPFYTNTNHAINLDYTWTSPYKNGNSLYITITQTMLDSNGVFRGAMCTDLYLSTLQSIFSTFHPTPRSQLFALDQNRNLVVSSIGDLLTWEGRRINLTVNNVSVLRGAGTVLPSSISLLTGLFRATFEIVSDEGKTESWLLSAQPFRKFRTNWAIAVVTPEDEFSGEVKKATRNTIIIVVCIVVFVFAIILSMIVAQTRMVEGSKQSLLVAQEVANDLISYNTDDAEESLENASKPTFINELDGTESTNYVSRPLIKALSKIVSNLKLYRAHLPAYLLGGGGGLADGLAELEDEDDGNVNPKATRDSSRSSLHKGMNNSNRGAATAANRKSHGSIDQAAMDPTNPYFVKMDDIDSTKKNNNKNNNNNDDRNTALSNSTVGKHAKNANQVAMVALLRNTGDFVDRVVLVNLNLSYVTETVLPIGKGNKQTLMRNFNRVIEILLDYGASTDVTIHSMIGDQLSASVNAVARTAHADIKSLRFLFGAEVALKKEISEWIKNDTENVGVNNRNNNNNAPASPYFAPHHHHRSLLAGSVALGSCWQQLGGNDKRQQFFLVNFSEEETLRAAFETGVRSGFVCVSRVIQQNCDHEFLFRGAATFVPGEHSNNNQNNANAASSSSVSQSANRNSSSLNDGETPTGESSTLHHKIQKAATVSALPLYELVTRKNLKKGDEWMYLLTDQNTGKTQDTAKIFNEIVMQVCRGDVENARANLARIREIDSEAPFLACYKNLERSIQRL